MTYARGSSKRGNASRVTIGNVNTRIPQGLPLPTTLKTPKSGQNMASPPPSIRRTPPPSTQDGPPIPKKPSTAGPRPVRPDLIDALEQSLRIAGTHMLKERRTITDRNGKRVGSGANGVEITTLCGKTGHPYNGEKGLRSTVWATLTTCPDCMAQPSIAKLNGTWKDQHIES